MNNSSEHYSMMNIEKISEKELSGRLFKAYVKGFVVEIEHLEGDNDFVREESVNGVSLPFLIMYKLKAGDNGETMLLSADGHRGYEFLI